MAFVVIGALEMLWPVSMILVCTRPHYFYCPSPDFTTSIVICVKIGQRVWSLRVPEKKITKKSQESDISRICPEIPRGRIFTKLGMIVPLVDVINCDKLKRCVDKLSKSTYPSLAPIAVFVSPACNLLYADIIFAVCDEFLMGCTLLTAFVHLSLCVLFSGILVHLVHIYSSCYISFSCDFFVLGHSSCCR